MKYITTWEDVSEFAGKLVAFHCDNYYRHGGLRTDRFPTLRFAIIDHYHTDWSHDGGKGYGMSLVLKKEEVPGNCCLGGECIKGKAMRMRIATEEEYDFIAESIRAGIAKTECGRHLPERAM